MALVAPHLNEVGATLIALYTGGKASPTHVPRMSEGLQALSGLLRVASPSPSIPPY